MLLLSIYEMDLEPFCVGYLLILARYKFLHTYMKLIAKAY